LLCLLIVVPNVVAIPEIRTTFDNHGLLYTISGVIITSGEPWSNVSIVCSNVTIASLQTQGEINYSFKDCGFGEYVWVEYQGVPGEKHQVPDLFIPWSSSSLRNNDISFSNNDINGVPEFSTWTLILACTGALIGLSVIRTRKL